MRFVNETEAPGVLGRGSREDTLHRLINKTEVINERSKAASSLFELVSDN